MSKNQTEGSFIKQLGYILLAGIIYYFGGWGWSALFTKDKEERDKAGKLNILLLGGELILLLIVMIADGKESNPTFGMPFLDGLIIFIAIHAVLSIIGALIAAILQIFRN